MYSNGEVAAIGLETSNVGRALPNGSWEQVHKNVGTAATKIASLALANCAGYFPIRDEALSLATSSRRGELQTKRAVSRRDGRNLQASIAWPPG